MVASIWKFFETCYNIFWQLIIKNYNFFSIPRRDVVLPLKDDDEDEQRKIIAAPSMNKGRKGYLPKKIRTSVDSQTNIIPGQFAQGQQSFSDSELPASPMSQRRNR